VPIGVFGPLLTQAVCWSHSACNTKPGSLSHSQQGQSPHELAELSGVRCVHNTAATSSQPATTAPTSIVSRRVCRQCCFEPPSITPLPLPGQVGASCPEATHYGHQQRCLHSSPLSPSPVPSGLHPTSGKALNPVCTPSHTRSTYLAHERLPVDSPE